MEEELARMVIRLIGDNADYRKMLTDALTETKEVTNKISLDFLGMGTALTTVGGVIAAGFGSMARSAVYSAGKFEQTTIAFETMLGSAQQTATLLNDLTEFAAKTPFEMPEIEQAARGLVQFGERGEDLIETLNILGNAASGTSTNFGMVALIFNQIRGVGKLLTQDFRQLSTRGILSLDDLAKHYHTTLEGAQAMLSSGRVTFQDVRDIFKELSADGGRFANLMERQSTSMLGLMSTLSDDFNIVLRQLGQELLPVSKDVVSTLLSITGAIRSMSPEAKRAIALVGGLTAAMGAAMTAIGGYILTLGTLRAAYKAATGETLTFGVAMKGLPALLGGTSVLALAGIFAYLKSEIDSAKRSADGVRALANTMADKRLENIFNEKDLDRQTQLFNLEFERRQTAVLEAQKALQEYQQTLEKTKASSFIKGKIMESGLQPLIEDLKIAQAEFKNIDSQKDRLGKETGSTQESGINAEATSSLVEFNKKLQDEAMLLTEEINGHKMSAEAIELHKRKLEGANPVTVESTKVILDHVEALRKEAQLKNDIDSLNKSLEEQLTTYGMTAREVEIWKLEQRGATEELKQAKDAMAQLETKDLQTKISDITKRLQEQHLTLGMTAEEAELYKLKMAGATEEQLAGARAALAAVEEFKKQEEQTNKTAEAMNRLKQSFGVDATEFGSLEAMTKLAQYRASVPDIVAKAGDTNVMIASKKGEKSSQESEYQQSGFMGSKAFYEALSTRGEMAVQGGQNTEELQSVDETLKQMLELQKQDANKQTVTLMPANLGSV